MDRMRVAFVHKIVPLGVVAFLLFGAPLQLAAQEREARGVEQISVIERLASLWNDLTDWLNGGVVPQKPEQPTENLENGCAVDPHGGCRD